MPWKKEFKPLIVITGIFLLFFFLPAGTGRFDNAVSEALQLAKWYAREHVILCLVPAFFIAGGISVFLSQASVMKYLGAGASKIFAYGVASVSGSVLAVCSCTVLPLFAGIYRMGAGIGPASAFLYSGPAINILAIILTGRVLGIQLGMARAVSAVLFSIVIGLLMHLFFRKEEQEKIAPLAAFPDQDAARPLWKTAVYFMTMILILVFANWAKPPVESGIWYNFYLVKWLITGSLALLLAIELVVWFKLKWWKLLIPGVPALAFALLVPHEPLLSFSAVIIGLSFVLSRDKTESGEWFASSWGFAKQILPLLFFGVLLAGLLLGRPGNEGLIPSSWISMAVGSNSLLSVMFASVVGAFMYFATLTEIPILQGLVGNGMADGPALALLLSGPALSLPNMLVIRSVIGTKKTVVFVGLVIVMATIAGMLYGMLF
ncbi:MAG: permease [Fibrobacteria bacterium]|nr:permease [Fibrobacteria bacterium]